MLKLEDIRPNEGATHDKKRKGRGIASGMGKTACRGNNGKVNVQVTLTNAVLKADKCHHTVKCLN